MPSPIGHVLGGVAAAWAFDLVPGSRAWRTAGRTASAFRRAGGTLTAVCAGLAALPDADLLVGPHRTVTHSVTAALLVTIVAAAVTGWVTEGPVSGQQRRVTRVALMCGIAYASHLVLDWVSADPSPPFGIQLLWPFSDRWFIAAITIFPGTERRELLSRRAFETNLHALVWETIWLLPLLVALWLVRVKALARFATQLSRSDHAA